MPFPTFLAGQILTADDLSAGQRTALRKNSNQIVNNSTAFVDADDITFEAEPAGEYEINLYAFYKTDPAADIKFEWLVPPGASMRRHTWGADLASGDSNSTSMRLRGGSAGTDISAGSGGAGAVTMYREAIHLIMGGTAGTVKLRFAQDTADVSDTVLRAETWFTWQRVG